MSSDVLFTAVPVFIVVVGVLVIGAAVGIFGKVIRNSRQPVLPVPATVVAKRAEHSRRSSATSYHVTIQNAAGQRQELATSGALFGLLAEGDQGTAHVQGWLLKSFDRSTTPGPQIYQPSPSVGHD